MATNPSFRHSLQNSSIWKGEGQHAKHKCCKELQNAEFQFTTVQTRQEDDIANGLRPDEADIVAVLRAIRDILPGESIRYQHSEKGGNNPECDCCFHIGLCQISEKETMLETMASVPIQSFPETWKPKIGELFIVYTGNTAQRWKVNHIKNGIGTTVTIKFEDSEMTVDQSWFIFDANQGSLMLQRLGFFHDMYVKDVY